MKYLQKLLLFSTPLVASPFLLNATAKPTEVTNEQTSTLQVSQYTYAERYTNSPDAARDLGYELNYRKVYLNANNTSKIKSPYFLKSITCKHDTTLEEKYWSSYSGSDFWISIMGMEYVKKAIDWSTPISNSLYLSPKKLTPFTKTSVDLSLEEKIIWSENEWLQNIHADLIFTKDKINPFIFTDVNDFFTYYPVGCKNSTPFKTIKTIPYMQISVISTYDPNYYAVNYKFLEPQKLKGSIDVYSYLLENMFETKYVLDNKARFGVGEWFRTSDYEGHKEFSDTIENKCNFKLYYKTCDMNDINREINLCKTFAYEGMNTNIDAMINHGKFIPIGIELEEYRDYETYIQPQYCSLT